MSCHTCYKELAGWYIIGELSPHPPQRPLWYCATHDKFWLTSIIFRIPTLREITDLYYAELFPKVIT